MKIELETKGGTLEKLEDVEKIEEIHPEEVKGLDSEAFRAYRIKWENGRTKEIGYAQLLAAEV